MKTNYIDLEQLEEKLEQLHYNSKNFFEYRFNLNNFINELKEKKYYCEYSESKDSIIIPFNYENFINDLCGVLYEATHAADFEICLDSIMDDVIEFGYLPSKI